MKSFGTVFQCLLETGGVPVLAVWYGCVRNLAAVWPVSLREEEVMVRVGEVQYGADDDLPLCGNRFWKLSSRLREVSGHWSFAYAEGLQLVNAHTILF